MLRRVDSDSVTVFIALSRSAKVTLSIYDEAEFGTGNYRRIQWATAPTLPVGLNLHVLAIQARMAAGQALEPERNYSYDVMLEVPDPPVEGDGAAPGTTVWTLEDLGLLEGDHALGFAPQRLPSFALPPRLENLRLVHGSCRKSGGEDADALPLLDDLLKKSYASPLERPHQLLLTGDQIYADDVPACHLAMLRDCGQRLLTWKTGETLAYDGGEIHQQDSRLVPGRVRKTFKEALDAAQGQEARSQAAREFKTRGDFILAQTGFTSTEVDAHLIFLGEYFAQYLSAWSPELWPRDGHGTLNLGSVEECLTGLTDEWDAKAKSEYAADAGKARSRAIAYASQLGKVRRALANIPTYTILDDHEITDDWNIHRDWFERVLASLAGKRIVRNGLIAYAVFQDWGNQPDRYADGPGKALLDAIRFDSITDLPPLAANPDMLDASLGLKTVSVDPVQRMRWDHVVYGQEHQILFLDTRTWRGFSSTSHGRAPAALIARDAMALQFDPDRLYPGRLTFIVSAGPVFGIRLVEFFQSVLATFTSSGVEEADRELWTGDEAAFRDLLLRLLVLERAIFLSGDVHYSFAKRMTFTRSTDLPLRAATLVQLCCSSLRNEIAKTKALEIATVPVGFSGSISNNVLHYSVDQRELAMRLLQIFEAAILETNEAGVPDADYFEHLHQTYFALKRQIDLKLPVVVDDWPGPAYLQAQEILDQYRDQWVGSWKYEVEGITDFESLRFLYPQNLEPDSLLTGLTTVPWNLSSPELYVIGRNNLGMLTFRMEGGQPITIVQRMLWRRKLLNVERILSLDLAADLRLPL